MRFKSTLALALLWGSFLPMSHAQVLLRGNLFFASDADALTTAHQQHLTRWLDSLQQLHWRYLTIEAYTDSVGSAAYNEALAQRRAASVRDFLLAQSVDSGAIKIGFFGESYDPDTLLSQALGEGLNANRRVDLVAYRQLPGQVPEEMADVRDLYRRIRPGYQTFTYRDAYRDQVIETASGLLIGIPGQSLVCRDGHPYRGQVELRVQELRGLAAVLRRGIATQAKDGSHGRDQIFELKALGQCGPLKLKDGAGIMVLMPVGPGGQHHEVCLARDWLGQPREWLRSDLPVHRYAGQQLQQYWTCQDQQYVPEALTLKEKVRNVFRSWRGKPLIRRGHYRCIDQGEALRAQWQKALGPIEAEELADQVDSAQTYLGLRLDRLSWVNCRNLDHRVAARVHPTDFVVTGTPRADLDLKLIIEETHAVLAGEEEGDRVVFRQVPEGARVRVVGVSYRGEQPQL